jgi:hypothetical protein
MLSLIKNRYKFVFLILFQLFLFRNYLFPFLAKNIVVKGISCTCPDAEIIGGKSYLKSITPDSLLKYNLDFSEIYFTNRISTSSDPMGVHEYVIKGNVVGKESISEEDNHYYPLFKIESYSETFLFEVVSLLLRILILFQLYIFFTRMLSQKKTIQ